MPAKMISEMPLPMPRSVIRSPSHMMKAVPAVSVITVMKVNHTPSLGTTIEAMPRFAEGSLLRPMDASQREMPMPCTTARTIEP